MSIYICYLQLIGASPKATLGGASTKQVRRGMKVYKVQLGSRYIRNVAIGIVNQIIAMALKQTIQQGVATDTGQQVLRSAESARLALIVANQQHSEKRSFRCCSCQDS